VLLTCADCAEVRLRLERFFDVESAADDDVLERSMLAARLAGKSALVAARAAPIDEALLASLPHLKAVCVVGASHATIDLDACTRAGVIVTNTVDLGSGEVAQRRMALAATDNLIAAFGFGRAGGHPPNLLNADLRCTLGCCL
jgi:lactate dehydrogenase-like 2-hydroxyacid dehydrogenase